MKNIILVLLTVLMAGCTFEPPTRPADAYENPIQYPDITFDHPKASDYQAYLDAAVAEGLPGGVFLIRTPQQGTWVGAAGFADIANQIPWQPSTLSRVGSVTKLFAGTVLVLLDASGDLDLDEPAKTYLPKKIVNRIENLDRCTIRQLLNHNSGIHNYLGSTSLVLEALGSYRYEYQPKHKLLEYSYDQPAEYAPGEGWNYSNSNFLLLEIIAEKAAGIDSRTLLDSLIIQPLGLRGTRYDPGAALPPYLARGYADYFSDGGLIDVTETNIEHFHYDGGIMSTVYDLADFIDALFLTPFLGESARTELLTTVATGGKSERGTDFYGSGIILEQHPTFGPVWGHSGTAMGYTAHVYHLERLQITIAALVNGSQNTIEDRSYEWFSPLTNDAILKLVLQE